MKKLYVNENLVAMGDYIIREVDEPSAYTVKIVYDCDYLIDQNNYWNEKTNFYSNHRHFTFDGEVNDKLFENLRKKEVDGKKYYPVYMLDHSVYCLSKTPFNDLWDSGLLGIAEVDNSDGDADSIFNDFFKELKAGMEGEIYGFEVKNELGDVVDSCYGFYGTREEILKSMYETISSEYGITMEDLEKAADNV